MERDDTFEVPRFHSVYRHALDPARRVQIPAKWRLSAPGAEFTLMLWQAEESARLRVLPPLKMAELLTKIAAQVLDVPEREALTRFMGMNSMHVRLDAVGRICLPEEMAEAAGISKEALLVGLEDCFEIWSPERYEQVKKAEAGATLPDDSSEP